MIATKVKSGFVKKTDAPIEVLIFDRMTIPIAPMFAKAIPALSVTGATLVVRLLAALSFALGALAIGASLAFLGFVLDALDGKMARIQVRHQNLHGLLDFLLDQLALCAMTLGIAGYVSAHSGSGLLVITFLATYLLVIAAGGSRFRLLGEIGLNWKTKGATQQFLAAEGPGRSGSLYSIYRKFAAFEARLAPYRMLARPTSIEAMFVFLILAPLVGFSWWALLLASVLLVPDGLAAALSCILLASNQDKAQFELDRSLTLSN